MNVNMSTPHCFGFTILPSFCVQFSCINKEMWVFWNENILTCVQQCKNCMWNSDMPLTNVCWAELYSLIS